MKTFKKNFLTLCALGIAAMAQATIINVNNATPSPGEYTSLQLAVDDAEAGDTLYLAPTNINYGDVIVPIQLSLIGPGFNVSSGTLGARAIVTNITISEVVASGSRLEGFQFNRLTITLPSNSILIDLVVSRCIIDDGITTANGDDLNNSRIEGNIFTSPTNNFFPADFNFITVRNNIFNGYISSIDNSQVTQNIFLGVEGGGVIVNNVGTTNSDFTNNILIGRNFNIAAAGNNLSGNCTFSGTSNNIPGPGTNLIDVDPSFMDAPLGLFSFENDYTLSGDSPCVGAGAGGEDIGAYGGEGIYRRDGEPSIPIIRVVNVPGGNTVPANSTFTITIQSEAHE